MRVWIVLTILMAMGFGVCLPNSYAQSKDVCQSPSVNFNIPQDSLEKTLIEESPEELRQHADVNHCCEDEGDEVVSSEILFTEFFSIRSSSLAKQHLLEFPATLIRPPIS